MVKHFSLTVSSRKENSVEDSTDYETTVQPEILEDDNEKLSRKNNPQVPNKAKPFVSKQKKRPGKQFSINDANI